MILTGEMRKQIIENALNEIQEKAMKDFKEMMEENEGTLHELINSTDFWEFEEHMSFYWDIIRNCEKGRKAINCFISLEDIEVEED